MIKLEIITPVGTYIAEFTNKDELDDFYESIHYPWHENYVNTDKGLAAFPYEILNNSVIKQL